MTAINQFTAHVGLDWADKNTMSVFSLKMENAYST